MATVTAEPLVESPSGQSVKLPNGLILAWGNNSVDCSSSGGRFGVYGSRTIDMAPFGITTVITAIASTRQHAAYSNCGASPNGSSILVTMGADTAGWRDMSWFVIGR